VELLVSKVISATNRLTGDFSETLKNFQAGACIRFRDRVEKALLGEAPFPEFPAATCNHHWWDLNYRTWIASQFRDGRWIYKISISEGPTTWDTFDNWVPGEWLEKTK
jgi:hypothetical protein